MKVIARLLEVGLFEAREVYMQNLVNKLKVDPMHAINMLGLRRTRCQTGFYMQFTKGLLINRLVLLSFFLQVPYFQFYGSCHKIPCLH